MTSYRVMKQDEYSDTVIYRLGCSCGNPECDLVLEIDCDPKLHQVRLHIFGNTAASIYWNYPKWYQRLWRRFKYAFHILFYGEVELHSEMLINGKEHIDSIIEVLEEAKQSIETYINSRPEEK